MASHSTGAQLNAVRSNGPRAFFSGLPVGKEPDLVEYFNDFLVDSDYVATDWVVTETQAGATQGIAADVTGGALALVNSAADDDVNQLQSTEEWFKLTSGKRAWFEARFKVSHATQSDLLIGFATTDTTPITTTDCVGFRKLDGSTSLTSITEDNTSETTNTVATMADDTYVTAGFMYDGKGTVKFYVKNSSGARAEAASHTTNIEVTNKLALTLHLTNGDGNARTLTVDYVYAAMER